MKLLELLKQKNQKISERYLKPSNGIYQYLGISFEEFEFDAGSEEVTFPFFAEEKLQAHPGIVHGGIVATLCDTGMGALAMILSVGDEKVVFTANMNVHYRTPMETRSTYQVTSRLISKEGSKLTLQVSILCGEVLVAEAEGLFIQKPFII